MACIPDPAPFFKPLYMAHNGDFKVLMHYTSEWSTWQTKRPSCYPEQGILTRAVEGEISLKGLPNISSYKNQRFPVSVWCHKDLYATSILLILCKCCLNVWGEFMVISEAWDPDGSVRKTTRPCKPLRANYLQLLQFSCSCLCLIITASSCYIGGASDFRVWFLPLKA